MSSTDRAKKREQRRNRRQSPSAPRVIGANDNHANDNAERVEIAGVVLDAELSRSFREAEANQGAVLLDDEGRVVRDRDGKPKPDHAKRREAAEAFVQIQLHLEKEHGAARMKAIRKEIAALEAGRGSKLSIEQLRDRNGKDEVTWRVRRDGLATLKGSLGQNESEAAIRHAAALRFRTDYERIDPERRLTPPALMRESGRGGSSSHSNKEAESWDRVRSIYLMIAGVPVLAFRDGERPNMPNLPAGHPAMRSIHALNEIAGKGSNLGDMTSSGSVKARIRDDLIRGLDCAAIVYGLE